MSARENLSLVQFFSLQEYGSFPSSRDTTISSSGKPADQLNVFLALTPSYF